MSDLKTELHDKLSEGDCISYGGIKAIVFSIDDGVEGGFDDDPEIYYPFVEVHILSNNNGVQNVSFHGERQVRALLKNSEGLE